MSIETIQLLQRLNSAVEGVKNTPDFFPAQVLESDLVLALCRSEDGTAKTTGGLTEARLLYSSIFLLTEAHQQALPLAQKMKEEIAPRVIKAYTDPANKFLAYGNPNEVAFNTNLPDGIRVTGLYEQEYLGKLYYAFRVSALLTEVEHTIT